MPPSSPATKPDPRDPTWNPARWLPTTRDELDARGWDEVDVILVTGDAYVDHPSFGAAVVGRIIEREGFRVAIVPQPNWRDDLRDFKKLGRPRLFFGVTAGCMDSMVNRYTAGRRLRSDDAYTPDGAPGFRPDYAVTTYTRILKQLWPDVPVMIGGIEASLRRVSHYDYWSDVIRPSVLAESGADLLVYGMGELPSDMFGGPSDSAKEAPEGEDVLDGVEVTDLDSQARRQLGIPANIRGALVTNVDPNSNAAEGLRPGDVILEINRQPVKNADDAIRLSKGLKNDRVLLRVWSGGAGPGGITRYVVIENSKNP